MKITLITVGKIKEKFYRDAIAEYSKRLSRYCSLEILELPDGLFVVRFSFDDAEAAINLFKQDNPHQLMRKSHRRKA